MAAGEEVLSYEGPHVPPPPPPPHPCKKHLLDTHTEAQDASTPRMVAAVAPPKSESSFRFRDVLLSQSVAVWSGHRGMDFHPALYPTDPDPPAAPPSASVVDARPLQKPHASEANRETKGDAHPDDPHQNPVVVVVGGDGGGGAPPPPSRLPGTTAADHTRRRDRDGERGGKTTVTMTTTSNTVREEDPGASRALATCVATGDARGSFSRETTSPLSSPTLFFHLAGTLSDPWEEWGSTTTTTSSSSSASVSSKGWKEEEVYPPLLVQQLVRLPVAGAGARLLPPPSPLCGGKEKVRSDERRRRSSEQEWMPTPMDDGEEGGEASFFVSACGVSYRLRPDGSHSSSSSS